ncbi:MAG: Holliday junction resolvase RuvX [FCB group bacterium]|nr:Holliday junction resolvase RuvX [FCB group bacterium]
MGRTLGLDHGDTRIGLALSDPTGVIARPFKTLVWKNLSRFTAEIKAIIEEWEITQLVVGLPVNMSGEETAQTEKVKKFITLLESFNLPVFTIDERLSSISAQKALVRQEVKTGHNKAAVDSTAAAIFLQQFLDMGNR